MNTHADEGESDKQDRLSELAKIEFTLDKIEERYKESAQGLEGIVKR